ncbi:MAG: MFS transporter [Chloroflexota bacterium]|nr:MFS transporter [Chloroflexota bacterium]
MLGRGLLRTNAAFRFLWLARVGSLFGDWFNQVALAQVTLALTHSSAAIGLVLLCRSLPAVAIGPFVGPVVDRFPKKPLLIATDLLRAACALGYAGAVIAHATWFLYVGSLLLGLSGVLFNPARAAAIPLVVAPDELPEANALDVGTTGIVQIAGAACGGVIAVAVGPILCFAINAASYLWSALAIRRARWDEADASRRTRSPYLASLRAGFREAARNRIARAIIAIGMSWGLAGGGYYVLIPLLGDQIYHLGGLGIGLLYAIDGIGVLAGSFLVRRFVAGNRHRAVVWYGVAYLTQALFFGLLAQSTLIVVGGAMLLLMRISSGVIIPLDTSLLQMSAAPHLRGRLFALHEATYGGVMQVSYVMAGYAYAHIGVPHAGLLVGAMSLICGVSWLWQFGAGAIAALRGRATT